MALIVCEKCGKNISDTVERCIHCGASIAKANSATSPVENTIKDRINGDINAAPSDFNLLSTDDKIVLERSFLSQDDWAMRYKRCQGEVGKFAKPFVFCLAAMFLFLKIYFGSGLLGTKCINPTFEKLLIYSLIALGVLITGMLLYSALAGIYFKVSPKKYIYMKKFQKWLLEERNIEYTPIFVSVLQKSKFDSINIEGM